MIERNFTVSGASGLDARASIALNNAAIKFKSRISLHFGQLEVDAKDLMGVVLLKAGHRAVVRVSIDGVDQVEAMNTMAELFEPGAA